MAHLKIDQTADLNHAELYKFAKLYDLPDFVKSASTDELNGQELPGHVYADVREPKQFPCNTKIATYLSCLWFLEKRAHIPSKIASMVEARLDRFAQYWNISKDVQQLKTKNASFARSDLDQLPDSSFALVRKESGLVDRRYPLRNALEVKAAADWFANNRDSFVYDERKDMAQRILDQANKYCADITNNVELLHKQAGRGFCTTEKAAEFIEMRARVTRAPAEVKQGLFKLAADVRKMDALVFNNCVVDNLARIVDNYDRAYNVKLSSATQRLEDVLFENTQAEVQKLAQEICPMTTGSIYEIEQFGQLKVADISDLFGPDFAKEVSKGLKIDSQKMAEVAQTLPRPDAQMLDRLMEQNGLAPIAKQASFNSRPTAQQLLAY